jgi:hypothetical protein
MFWNIFHSIVWPTLGMYMLVTFPRENEAFIGLVFITWLLMVVVVYNFFKQAEKLEEIDKAKEENSER